MREKPPYLVNPLNVVSPLMPQSMALLMVDSLTRVYLTVMVIHLNGWLAVANIHM